MNSITILSLSAVAFAVIWGAGSWMKRRRNALWQNVGQTLGLRFHLNATTNQAELNGVLDGVRIKVETLVERSGKHSTTYTAVAARIPGKPPFDLNIRHEGLFQKIGKVFGGEDIQVGDERLDKQFIFTGDNPRRVRTLVTNPAVKSALLTTQQHCKTLRVERGDVCLKEVDGGEDQDILIRRIRMSVTLAAALGEASGGSAQLAPPMPGTPSAQPARQAEPLTGAADDPNNWW